MSIPTASADRPGRRLLLACALTPMLLFAAGCGVLGSDNAAETDSRPGGGDGEENADSGGDGNGEGGQNEDGDGLPASTTNVWLEGESRFSVTSLERIDDSTVVLHFTLENLSEEDIGIRNDLRAEHDETNNDSPTGVGLVDPTQNQAYFPWTTDTEEATCFCTEYEETSLPPAELFEFWAAFPAPPEGVDHMSVITPVTPPLHDIPITDGGEAPQNAPADLADPYIVDLRARDENTVSSTSRDESGSDVAVNLSSDVLFDLNESELTSAANDELEDVAGEIDESEPDLVQVDGHTDDSGDDAINEPLSQDRAEAVRDALEGMVTSSGLSYEAEGHGSSDPVADNDTEDGAQKNRRVTVSFDKQQSA